VSSKKAEEFFFPPFVTLALIFGPLPYIIWGRKSTWYCYFCLTYTCVGHIYGYWL